MITLTGRNFGTLPPSAAAATPAVFCVMVAWVNRPDFPAPNCSGAGEPYPGAWGIVMPAPLSWSDSQIVLTVPPGIGVREVLLSVALQVRASGTGALVVVLSTLFHPLL